MLIKLLFIQADCAGAWNLHFTVPTKFCLFSILPGTIPKYHHKQYFLPTHSQGATQLRHLLAMAKPNSPMFWVEVKNFTNEVVRLAGIKCFVALYGGDIQTETLDRLRYKTFVSSNNINLARLPPSEDVAGHHAPRCYHQVQ